jgi:hypothetical protein
MNRPRIIKVVLSIMLTLSLLLNNFSVIAQTSTAIEKDNNLVQASGVVQEPKQVGKEKLTETNQITDFVSAQENSTYRSDFAEGYEAFDTSQRVEMNNYQLYYLSGKAPYFGTGINAQSVVSTSENVQMNVSVKNPDGTTATKGYIEVREMINEYDYWSSRTVWIDGSETYTITDLEMGKVYEFRATPDYSDEEYTRSHRVIIKVQSDGSITYPNGDVVDTINLAFTNPQVEAMVYQGDGSPAIGMNGLNIFKVEGTREMYYSHVTQKQSGKWLIGGLEPGSYSVQAWAFIDTPYVDSKKYQITIDENGVSNVNVIELTLCTPQITGTVKKPDGELTSYGDIQIREIISEYESRGAKSGHINYSGSFKVGGLEPGKTYELMAVPGYYDETYTASRKIRVKVQNDGGITYLDGSDASIVDFTLTNPQLEAMVYLNDGSPAISVSNLEIFKVENNGEVYYGSTNQRVSGKWLIGGLEPGVYRLRAWPYGDTSYIPSPKYEIVIDQNELSNIRVLELKLGAPQITGIANNPDGTLARYGYIDIKELIGEYDWRRMKSANISYDGNYNIGGLEVGKTYELRAFPDRNTDGIASSKKVRVKVENDGSITYLNGDNASTINFTLSIPQIEATVLLNNGELARDICDIQINKVDSNGERYYTNSNQQTSGKWFIGGLEPGVYRIHAWPYGNTSYIPSSKYEVVIDENEVSNVKMLELRLGAPQITGIVNNPDGTLARFGYIDVREIIGESDWRGMRSANISSDGKYNIGGLEAGKTYELIAIPDYNSENLADSKKLRIKVQSDGRVTHLDGSDASSIDFMLTNPQLEAMVYLSDGSPAIGGNSLQIFKVEGTREIYYGYANQRASGKWFIGGLEPGVYRIHARSYGDTSYLPSPKYEIVIDENGVSDIKMLELKLGAPQITGIVNNPDGTLARYGYIDVREIIGGNDWKGMQSANISSDGNYNIGGLEIGKTYELRAFPDRNTDGIASSKRVRIQVQSDGSITYLNGDNASTINFTLSIPQFEATVLLSNNDIAWDVCFVEIMKVESNGERYYTSINQQTSGKWLIGGLEPGTYKIQAWPYGNTAYIPSPKYEIVIDENEVSNIKVLELKLGAPQITGTVRNPDGSPTNYGYINVTEIISETSTRGLKSANVSSNGSYSIGNLESGKVYELKACADRNNDSLAPSKKVRIKVESDGRIIYLDGESASVIDFTLSKPQLEAAVYLSDNTIAVDIGSINVYRIEGTQRIYYTGISQNTSGKWIIGGLKPGEYDLQVRPYSNTPYLQSQMYRIVIDENEICNIKSISMELGTVQISGTVKNPNGTQASYGYIDIREIITEYDSRGLQSFNVSSQGDYLIGNLEVGKIYELKACGDNNNDSLAPSKKVRVTVQSDGSVTYLTGEPANVIDFNLSYPQLQATINLNGSILGKGIGYLSIYRIEELQERFYTTITEKSSGKFIIGGLEPGTYNVQARSRGGALLLPSEKFQIEIDAAGNSNFQAITLTMKSPQLTGTVTNPDGTPVTNGYIDIREILGDNGFSSKPSISVNYNGVYILGGLEIGKIYDIKACISDDNDALAPSRKVRVKVENDGSISYLDGSIVGNINFTLTNPQLEASVYLSDNSAAIGIGSIRIYRLEGIKETYYTSIYQKMSGRWIIGGLEPGTYNVLAVPSNNTGLMPSERQVIVIDESGNSNIQSLSFILKNGINQLEVINTNPQDQSMDVPVNKRNISIMFNDNINIGSVFKIISLKTEDGRDVSIRTSIDKNVLTIEPRYNLDYNTRYFVIIPKFALSNSIGGALAEDYEFSFITESEIEPLMITNSYPNHNGTGIQVNPTISIEFNREINLVWQANGKDKGKDIRLISKDNRDIPVHYTVSGNRLIINPLEMLNYDTEYELVLLPNAVWDLSKNKISGTYKLTFTTEQFIGPAANVENTIVQEVKNNPITIRTINDLSVTITEGEYYSLPKLVTAILSEGSIVHLPITWETPKMTFSEAGTYVVNGYVEGYGNAVMFKLTILKGKEKTVPISEGSQKYDVKSAELKGTKVQTSLSK